MIPAGNDDNNGGWYSYWLGVTRRMVTGFKSFKVQVISIMLIALVNNEGKGSSWSKNVALSSPFPVLAMFRRRGCALLLMLFSRFVASMYNLAMCVVCGVE